MMSRGYECGTDRMTDPHWRLDSFHRQVCTRHMGSCPSFYTDQGFRRFTLDQNKPRRRLLISSASACSTSDLIPFENTELTYSRPGPSHSKINPVVKNTTFRKTVKTWLKELFMDCGMRCFVHGRALVRFRLVVMRGYKVTVLVQILNWPKFDLI
jgi:hypothetical protein